MRLARGGKDCGTLSDKTETELADGYLRIRLYPGDREIIDELREHYGLSVSGVIRVALRDAIRAAKAHGGRAAG